MIYCNDCKFRITSNLRSEVSYCSYYNTPLEAVLGCGSGKSKIITNADRIRAMSDEELAKFFDSELFLSPWCDMSCGYVEEAPCRQCMVKWLKQEADI